MSNLHKIGDRAVCDCGRSLVHTSEGWKHGGLGATNCVPRPVAMPIDDLDGDAGIVLPYHDAPEDEPDTLDAAIQDLGKLTGEIASVLGRWRVHHNLTATTCYQITQLWMNALRTVREPHA